MMMIWFGTTVDTTKGVDLYLWESVPIANRIKNAPNIGWARRYKLHRTCAPSVTRLGGAPPLRLRRGGDESALAWVGVGLA